MGKIRGRELALQCGTNVRPEVPRDRVRLTRTVCMESLYSVVCLICYVSRFGVRREGRGGYGTMDHSYTGLSLETGDGHLFLTLMR